MRSVRTALWALLACLAACTTPPLTLPKDFVALGDRGDGYRAITADDARLRVRTLDEATEGGIEFWSDALVNDCVQQRGYQLVERGEIADREGKAGRWLEFTANVDGERVGLLVAVWVRERWMGKPCLQVAEFAARSEVFAARLPAVKASLATMH